MNKQNIQLTEISDEELEQVTGGAGIDCSRTEYRNIPGCLQIKTHYTNPSGGTYPQETETDGMETIYD